MLVGGLTFFLLFDVLRRPHSRGVELLFMLNRQRKRWHGDLVLPLFGPELGILYHSSLPSLQLAQRRCRGRPRLTEQLVLAALAFLFAGQF